MGILGSLIPVELGSSGCGCCDIGCLLQLCWKGSAWNVDSLAVGMGVGSFCCIFGVVPVFLAAL